MKFDHTVLNPNPGSPDTIVDIASAQFLEKLAFTGKHSGAASWRLLLYTTSSVDVQNANPVPGSEHSVIRATYIFKTADGRELGAEAWLIHSRPENAVNDLRSGFGLAAIAGLQFVDDPSQVKLSPVGAPWPIHGPNVHHVSDVFKSADWKLEQTTTFRKDGRDVEVKLILVQDFEKPQTFFAGGAWVAAWQEVGGLVHGMQ